MIPMHVIFIGILLSLYCRRADAIMCYQCTECPEPFTEGYPYVAQVNNTNFLAQCTKTVTNLGDGRHLVSKGTVFFCPTQSSVVDTQIFCCDRDYCNSSFRLHFSISYVYVLFWILVRTYW